MLLLCYLNNILIYCNMHVSCEHMHKLTLEQCSEKPLQQHKGDTAHRGSVIAEVRGHGAEVREAWPADTNTQQLSCHCSASFSQTQMDSCHVLHVCYSTCQFAAVTMWYSAVCGLAACSQRQRNNAVTAFVTFPLQQHRRTVLLSHKSCITGQSCSTDSVSKAEASLFVLAKSLLQLDM